MRGMSRSRASLRFGSRNPSHSLIHVQCFALGAEVGSHRRGHNYSVENPSGVPIFGSTSCGTSLPWHSKEELELVACAEKFNLGNWEDVAESLRTGRDPQDVKEHYDRFYIRGKIGKACRYGFHRYLPDGIGLVHVLADRQSTIAPGP